MNYIKEMNAFYDCVEREPLSASAVSLWNTLLHINNKTAWADEFSVAGTVLKLKGGLTDSSFKRARKELEERGFIEHRSRGTRLAPIYRMKRLYLEYIFTSSVEMEQGDRLRDVKVVQQVGSDLMNRNVSSNNAQEKMERDVNEIANPITGLSLNQMMNHEANLNMNQMTAPLNKENKTNQNETKQSSSTRANATVNNATNKTENKDKSDAIVFYQENFGIVSPYLAEEILFWINDLGDELVIEGMRRALVRGKVNFGYVKGVLKSWVKQGISSVGMLRVTEKERKHNVVHNQKRSTNGGRNREVVPDWFWERKEHKKEQLEVEAEEEEVDVGEILREFLTNRAV